MIAHPDPAALDRLKTRIQGLRSKTTDNGCTEAEALLAAGKVAELLDRYDLSLTDVEIRDAACAQREYKTYHKKRIPLDGCIGAVANFCDCRVWREKNEVGDARYVFFGLRSDIEVAHYLTEVIDNAVRFELGRYKTSAGYRRFRYQDRHIANSSFTLGMVPSIADKLKAMKRERDVVNNSTGRDLVVLKVAARPSLQFDMSHSYLFLASAVMERGRAHPNHHHRNRLLATQVSSQTANYTKTTGNGCRCQHQCRDVTAGH